MLLKTELSLKGLLAYQYTHGDVRKERVRTTVVSPFFILYSTHSDCLQSRWSYNMLSFLTENLVGAHDAPIRCVEYCPEVNVMVTGSWDQTVKLWDPRTPCNAGTFSQPEKVCTRCCIPSDTLNNTSSDWM